MAHCNKHFSVDYLNVHLSYSILFCAKMEYEPPDLDLQQFAHL